MNGIVQRYADPQFHCDVHHVEHPDTGKNFPIVEVPGGHTVPIRAKRDGTNQRHVSQHSYYIRRPGPESAEPATAREWDKLIRRCITESKDELTDSIRNIITSFQAGENMSEDNSDPIENLEAWITECLERWEIQVENEYGDVDNSPYQNGYWNISYSIVDDFDEPNLTEFQQMLREVSGRETGWPPWNFSEQGIPFNNVIELWLTNLETDGTPAHRDFWRAAPDGRLFMLRGYEADGQDNITPGDALDFIRPLWTIGECLLHAKRLARRLCDGDVSVMIKVAWNGIDGRKLMSLYPRRGVFGPTDRTAHQESVSVSRRFSTIEIENNLPEAVESLTQQLYQVFDFYQIDSRLVQKQLNEMQS